MNGYGRGADNQERGKGVVTRETFGMTFLIFGIILLVIATVGRYIFGEIGVSITAFLLGTFGYFVYPLLLLILYGSVCMVAGRSLIPAKWTLKFTALLCAAFLIAQLATSTRFFGEGFGAYLSGCYTAAGELSSATAGGALFGLVVYPLRSILSTAGAYVLFSLLAALALFVFLWGTRLKASLLGGEERKRPAKQPKEKKRKEEKGKTRPAPMPDPEPMMGYSRSAYGMPADDGYGEEDAAYADPYARQGYYAPESVSGRQNGYPSGASNGYRESDRNSDMNGYPNGYGGNGQYGYPAPSPHDLASGQYAQPQYDGRQYAQPQYPQQQYAQTQYPNYGYGQDGLLGYYGQPRPQRPVQGYYAPQDRESQGYGRNGHVGYYGTDRPQEPETPRSYSGRDILFSSTPAQDYTKNLIYNQDSYFNSRVRRSSVEPDDSPARKPDYTIPATYERPVDRGERLSERRTLGGSREVPKYTSHQELPRSDRRADTGRNGAESGKPDGFLRPDFTRSGQSGASDGNAARGSTFGDPQSSAKNEAPAPSSYHGAFFEQTEKDERAPLPRKIVEQRPERRDGYTFRAEYLNYPRVPAYKSPETPPEDIGRDAYANDVDDTEFSSAPSVDDIAPAVPETPQGIRRAAREPEPEPVKSDGFLTARDVTPEDTNPFDTPSAAKEDTISSRGRELGRGERSFGAPSEPEPSARTPERENKDTPAEDEYDPRASERGFRSLFSSSRGPDRVQLKNDGADYVGDGFSRNERGAGLSDEPPARRAGFGSDLSAARETGFGELSDGRRSAPEQQPPVSGRGTLPEPPVSGRGTLPEPPESSAPAFGSRSASPFEESPSPFAEESRAVRGLRQERTSASDLFDDDLLPEEDVPSLPRARESARENTRERGLGGGGETSIPELPAPPAPKPKKHVYKRYRRPSLDLFQTYDDAVSVSPEEIEYNSSVIMETLAGFRVDAEVVKVTSGPAVTRYDIDIPRNISVRSVIRHDEEIAMRLHARDGVNMYSNSEVGAISIEVPNKHRAMVGIRSIMTSPDYRNDDPSKLMFVIGKDVEGRAVCGDVVKMTHILVAGATNSGKSVCLNALLVSLICKYSPEDLRIILIDPKKIEFTPYDGLPHLMINEIITDTQKAIMSLNWAIKEMERRYELFEQKTRSGTAVRNINEYNANLSEDEEKLPKIVIVVDELADLMSVAKKDIEERIQRLTQKARAAGIHLVIATQRPSVDVITGVIKGNLPTRMAFRVIQEVDSRTILDESGAEKLLGNGDMLYKTGGMFNCLRVQGAFLSSAEVAAVVANIKENNEAYFDPEVSDYINRTAPEEGGDDDDADGDGGTVGPEYIKALAIVVKLGSASISLIQRKCAVGYNHAGKIIEWMELMGYISPFDGKAKARTVLLTKEEFESKYGDLG